jgi:hypothetical protein
VKTNFFECLDFALQFAPPGPEEKDIWAKLAKIGIGAGKTLDLKDTSLAEVGLGMKDGEAKIDQYLMADTAIRAPNSDTPYSFLGMDLRAEPIVLMCRRSTRSAISTPHHQLWAGPT